MKSRETLRFDGFQRASLKYNANRNSFEYDRLVRKNAISAEIKLERTLPKQLRATQTRAYRVHFDAQRYLRDKMCIYQNDAAYGKCFASSYKHLNVSGLPTHEFPAYAGIAFPVTVQKLDFYNQTIITDSRSVLQIQFLSNGSGSTPGNSVASLHSGQTTLSVIVKPLITFSQGNAGLVLDVVPSIYITGIDSQADRISAMVSGAFNIVLAENEKICPAGFILAFDELAITKLKFGYCSKCGPGTYSVSALARFCFNCPVKSFCEGGDSVKFSLGDWTIMNGMYRLVGCPDGYQLVNSINGLFSHDLQQCIPCSPDQYILNSNNSNYTCQTCPVGAECDGKSLHGLVAGSLWKPDLSTGQYILLSCPPGYAIVNTLGSGRFSYINQECNICPASYYCLGGTNVPVTCSNNEFSPPGANSSSSCVVSVFVLISVAIPLAQSDFTSQKQEQFIHALAFASGQLVNQVVIQSFNPIRRRRSAGSSLQVEAEIATKNSAKANAILNSFDIFTLNNQLVDQGLPPCTLLSLSIQQTSESSNNSEWIFIGSLMGGFSLALFLAIVCIVVWRKMAVTEEEKQLEREMSTLRIKLKITDKDGFCLSNTVSWWHRNDDAIIIQKSYLEAAAHLGLLMDFDVNQFDAFCLCLECEASNRVDDGKKSAAAETAYSAICDWLLDVSIDLLKPDVLEEGGSLDMQQSILHSRLHQDHRFAYFCRKVSKARIWADNRNSLFERLKQTVQMFMRDMAQLCHGRFAQLSRDPVGPALIAFPSFPAKSCEDNQPEHIVRRQDHGEVLRFCSRLIFFQRGVVTKFKRYIKLRNLGCIAAPRCMPSLNVHLFLLHPCSCFYLPINCDIPGSRDYSGQGITSRSRP